MKTRFAIAPVFLLAACGSGADEARKDDPVATVVTALAQPGASTQAIDAYGVVEAGPGGQRALATQAEATVSRILAPTGTAVGAGQVVAILIPSHTARLDLARARSDAALATAALARAERLRKDGLASDADVETARAAATSAQAALQSAGARNGTLVLRAPVAGTVQNLTARPGDLIAAGTTVAAIGARSDLRGRISVDPAVARQVHTGQPVAVQAITRAGSVATTVQGVDPQVDAATRLAAVFARLPAGADFAAGEAIHARIAVSAPASGVIVPYAALFDDGGKSFVFTVSGGVAHRLPVRPGSGAGDSIAILSGVKAGDRVVVEGGTALEDGMKVIEAGDPARKGPRR